MPRFFTPPHMEFDRLRPKVLIRDCNWTDEEIQSYADSLESDHYDVYLYHDKMNDVQWFEGIRAMANKVCDARSIPTDVKSWFQNLEKEIK